LSEQHIFIQFIYKTEIEQHLMRQKVTHRKKCNLCYLCYRLLMNETNLILYSASKRGE